MAFILISGHMSEVSLHLPWGIKSHQASVPRILEIQQLHLALGLKKKKNLLETRSTSPSSPLFFFVPVVKMYLDF